jgi:hypothetical protein
VIVDTQPDYGEAIAGGAALGMAVIEGVSAMSRVSTANFIVGFAGTSAFVVNMLVTGDRKKFGGGFVITAVILSVITIIANVISYPKENTSEWYSDGCPSKVEAVIKPLIVLLLGLGIGALFAKTS